jgi:peptide chain release factor subunit 1
MIDRKEIQRLAEMRVAEGVLSAVVKLDPRLGYERGQAVMKFKGAYRRAFRAAGEDDRAVLERERDAVIDYLETADLSGRGVVIYSSTPAKVWEVVPLEVMAPSRVSVGPELDIGVLETVFEEYPRMAVVILDGDEARIYTADQGEEKAGGRTRTKLPLPGRHSQGGWSQARFQRHVEFHHTQLLKEAADRLEKLFHTRPFDRLVVVGVEEATKEFAEMLSEPVRERLLGRLTANFKHENDDHILDRARALREGDERASEAALVDRIRGQAEAGGHGVLGIDETIEAIVEGRVDTLAVAEGVEREGSACLNCDYFAATRFATCPVCSQAEVEELPDVVDYAIERALLSGARVNVVFGAAAEMLVAVGGIGAVLRYEVTRAD